MIKVKVIHVQSKDFENDCVTPWIAQLKASEISANMSEKTNCSNSVLILGFNEKNNYLLWL